MRKNITKNTRTTNQAFHITYRLGFEEIKTATQHFADFVARFEDPYTTFKVSTSKNTFVLEKVRKRKPKKKK